MVLLGPYCILLALFPKFVLTKVFDPSYARDPRVLSLFSGQSMMSYFLMVLAAALSARRMTRDIFFGSVVSSAVAVLLSWPLIRLLGMSGVIASMMCATTAMAAFLVYRYRASLRESVAPGFEVVLNEEPACAT